MSKLFELDKVVSTKKPNDCHDCRTRVDTYLKNVQEWQFAYNSLMKQAEAMAEVLEKIVKENYANQQDKQALSSWRAFKGEL